jgi:hypothetical protein
MGTEWLMLVIIDFIIGQYWVDHGEIQWDVRYIRVFKRGGPLENPRTRSRLLNGNIMYHVLHVWNIYLHLAHLWCKCW